MTDPVLIVGGGIAGLATALTLHQIGVDCRVYESARSLKPLGVGINVQPNAIRELIDLGITLDELDQIGIAAKEWALVGLNGNDIYAEPRGTHAGYKWPQYAMHRGQLHLFLYRKVVERLGPDAVVLGHAATGFDQDGEGVTGHFETKSGKKVSARGCLLLGADGIHSAIRAQMHPNQPPIHWGGAVMWRGVTRAKAIRTGSSFIGLGQAKRRLVIYPISQPDAEGFSLINWIAEVTYDKTEDWQKTGWYTQVPISDFSHHFEDMIYDWLDVPAMLAQADIAFENPMIDRDPINNWQEGRVLLIGDAAHPMYPTGSNGASQAIVDARKLGAAMVKHGVSTTALEAFNNELNEPINQVVLRNRGDGPFGLLSMVEERCGGLFDDINDVVPEAARVNFMKKYQSAAGFAREALNSASPTIAPGARAA